MSAVKTLFMSIQEDLEDGELSFAEIAVKNEVPISWVEEVADEMTDRQSEADPGDMDGDMESGLASVGWGTDESYVSDNDYFDDY